MRNIEKLSKMANVALISIHPEHVQKIVAGEKMWEFRRTWAKNPVDLLVVYATTPIKRIMAIIEVGEEVRGSRQRLWELSRDHQGGISRKKLFAYLEGKSEGVAVQLKDRFVFEDGIDPKELFGKGFRAPQSFQYMNQKEWLLIREQVSCQGSVMTEIGYCVSCVTQDCPTPKIKGRPGINCSFWHDGQSDEDTSEHWDCVHCGQILLLETAADHQCSPESISIKKEEDAQLPDWAR